MYALILSTNRRNKEPPPKKKQGPRKIKKQIKRNKTKPGVKNHKTQNNHKMRLVWMSCRGEVVMYCPLLT